MPVEECMQRMRHREYLMWQARLKRQWNTPNRTDFYLMQLARAIYDLPPMVWGKPPEHKDLDKFKIPFTFGDDSSLPKQTADEIKQNSSTPLLKEPILFPPLPKKPTTKEEVAEMQAKINRHKWMMSVGAIDRRKVSEKK